MNSVLTSVLALIVTLGVLIAFHEFGHYWVARRLGVKVLRFSIGFGKPILMRRMGADQTEYALSAIPLGGYVKMLDEREGEVPKEELHRAFNRQPVAKRIAIVAAGPIFNLIFAILAYFVMYSIGVPGIKPLIGEVQPNTAAYSAGLHAGDEIVAIDGEDTPTWSAAQLTLLDKSLGGSSVEVEVRDKTTHRNRVLNLDLSGLTAEQKQSDIVQHLGIETYQPPIAPVIGKLEPGGAAERDGLQVGDRVTAVNGTPVNDWSDWVEIIRQHPEQTLQTTIERNGVSREIVLTPARVKTDEGDIGRIGAIPVVPEKAPDDYLTEVKYGPLQAITVATAKTWQMSALTLRMIGEMIVGQVSVKNLSGPITIATYAGASASIGLTAFLSFLAVVSISLGVLNLLPIPLLDGGHLLYYVIELVRGKALSDEMQARLQQVGIVVLGMLMIVAIYNDIFRLIGK